MNREHWFRQKDWSPAIELAFFAKLSRARKKGQYLRIQAFTLAQSHPRVALDLLRRYFELGEQFDIAQAYCDKAAAQITLRDITGAIDSYQAALNREESYHHFKTGAYLLLPVLIVRERVVVRYAQALELLEKHRKRVVFPIDLFRGNAVLAIVQNETGNRQKAVDAANVALKAAALTHSGFSRHPNVGLVGPYNSDLVKRLKKIASRWRRWLP